MKYGNQKTHQIRENQIFELVKLWQSLDLESNNIHIYSIKRRNGTLSCAKVLTVKTGIPNIVYQIIRSAFSFPRKRQILMN